MIPAVVLAAGRSSRMGRAKATLPLDAGDTFLTRIVRTFLEAGVDDVVVVLGHEADAIVSSFSASGLPARFVVNHDYDRGQWSSLVAGLGVVDRPGVSATLMTGRCAARRRIRCAHAGVTHARVSPTSGSGTAIPCFRRRCSPRASRR